MVWLDSKTKFRPSSSCRRAGEGGGWWPTTTAQGRARRETRLAPLTAAALLPGNCTGNWKLYCYAGNHTGHWKLQWQCRLRYCCHIHRLWAQYPVKLFTALGNTHIRDSQCEHTSDSDELQQWNSIPENSPTYEAASAVDTFWISELKQICIWQ